MLLLLCCCQETRGCAPGFQSPLDSPATAAHAGWEHHWGVPGGSVVKNPPADAGDAKDTSSIPKSGRPPGVGNDNPLQYSCLENPMDREAWRDTVHGVAESQTQLSMHTCTICRCMKQHLKGEGSALLMEFQCKFTESLIIISARMKGRRPIVEDQLLGNFLFSSGSKGRWRSRT